MTWITRRTASIILIMLLLSSVAVAACSTQSAPSESAGLVMAAMTGMPAEVKSAPPTVLQAYQFAAANPEVMNQIPCYCGCGQLGHISNYDCYVQGEDENGAITYDHHAIGCSICVDITQDTMQMLRQGKTPAEIKTAIDQTYAHYGPSTMP